MTKWDKEIQIKDSVEVEILEMFFSKLEKRRMVVGRSKEVKKLFDVDYLGFEENFGIVDVFARCEYSWLWFPLFRIMLKDDKLRIKKYGDYDVKDKELLECLLEMAIEVAL